MAYTKADIILPFILILSIAAVVLVSLYSSPVEKNDVLCGDNSTNQHWPQKSYIEWDDSETVNCNDTTGACTMTRNGTTSWQGSDRFPSIFLVGIVGSLSSLLILLGESNNKGGSYYLRLLGLFISGICITVALAIFLGNMTGTHSPTFIDSCHPNPSIEELCKAAIEGIRTFVKVNCTTSANRGWPSFISYRASSFPLCISLMGYFTSGFLIWSMILSSKENQEACGCRCLASILAVLGTICIVCAAYFQLEAFLTDIGTGFALGFVMAVVSLGMMVIMYPKWRKPSEIQTLPFTTYDLPPVKKGDHQTTSPASADSSADENEKKLPVVGVNLYPSMYPSLA